MTLPDGIALGVLLSGLFFSFGRRKLTVAAALTGALLRWREYWTPCKLPCQTRCE
jgi:hypothetical protein